MNRAPFLIVGALMLSTVAWAIHLAVDPDPFSADAAVVVAGGLVVYGVIASAGLLIVRGRWSRYLAGAILAASVLLAVFGDPGPWYVAGLVLTAIALTGFTGPWFRGWIRRLPGATGPGPRAVALALGIVALVPAVGVASPAGLELGHGILGGAGVLLGWGYSRAQLWALWAVRLTLPVLAVPAIVQSPWGGRILLTLLTASVVVLAWSTEARLAVAPIMERLPGPRFGTPKTGDAG